MIFILNIINLKEIFDVVNITLVSDMMQQISFKVFTYYFKNNESLIYRILLYHPFCSLSPNKTIIGYLGGLSTLLFVFFTNYSIFTILMLYITGCMGDLLASYFKRLQKIENYSNLLGAHGGFLDRFDAIALNTHVIFLINFTNK
jgi:CDP-diglyceride synthetase